MPPLLKYVLSNYYAVSVYVYHRKRWEICSSVHVSMAISVPEKNSEMSKSVTISTFHRLSTY